MSQRRPRRTAANAAAAPASTPGRRHTAAHLSKLPPTITVDEAGDMLGISRRSAYRAAARGEIPTLRLGRRLLVPTPRLLALLGLTLDGSRDDAQEPEERAGVTAKDDGALARRIAAPQGTATPRHAPAGFTRHAG